MQNICLVTTQSFKQGKSGHQTMETFTFAAAVRGSHIVKTYLRYQLEKKLDAKQELNNTMDKQAVKVVKASCLVVLPNSVVFSCT